VGVLQRQGEAALSRGVKLRPGMQSPVNVGGKLVSTGLNADVRRLAAATPEICREQDEIDNQENSECDADVKPANPKGEP
jgi:hypothetical protein